MKRENFERTISLEDLEMNGEMQTCRTKMMMKQVTLMTRTLMRRRPNSCHSWIKNLNDKNSVLKISLVNGRTQRTKIKIGHNGELMYKATIEKMSQRQKPKRLSTLQVRAYTGLWKVVARMLEKMLIRWNDWLIVWGFAGGQSDRKWTIVIVESLSRLKTGTYLLKSSNQQSNKSCKLSTNTSCLLLGCIAACLVLCDLFYIQCIALGAKYLFFRKI